MKQIYSIFLTLVFFIGFGLFPSVGTGEIKGDGNWTSTNMSKSRLISAQTGTAKSTEIYLGLQIRLDKGWKTYWRNPGDAGLPPRFNWTLSDNVKTIDVLWPKPEKFETYGYITWGYEREVVFPVRITLKDPTKGLTGKLNAFYGICEEVCVPINQEFAINLPGNLAGQSEHALVIEHYHARVPAAVDGISPVQEIRFFEVSNKEMTVELRTSGVFETPVLILEGEDGDYFTVNNIEMSEGGKRAIFSVDVNLTDTKKSLKGRRFTATILDTQLAAEGYAIVQ